MSLYKPQWLAIAAAGLLMAGLYYLPTRTPLVKKGAEAEQTDSLALNGEAVLINARKLLDSNQLKQLAEIEARKAQASSVKAEMDIYIELSKTWNGWGQFAAGGFYAEKVAELQPTGEAWAIAGTTYGIAFKREQEPKLQSFAANAAIRSFQKAAELEPDTVRHRINEAMMYVDLSGVDPKVPPMTGAQKLLALDKEFPQNVEVNLALGRMSMFRSGDFKKAVKRLEPILEFPNLSQPDKLEIHYLLADCYQQLKEPQKVLFHYDAAIAIASDDIKGQLQRARQEYAKTAQ